MHPEGESFSNVLGGFSNASPQRPCDKRDAPQGLTCIYNGVSHREERININVSTFISPDGSGSYSALSDIVGSDSAEKGHQ